MPSAPNTVREGGCLCGAVRFRVSGALFLAACCHCTQCRRASGSAFAANASVSRDEVEFTGTDHVREYASSPGRFRAFCGRCGSPLYKRTTEDPGVVRLRLGGFDGDPGVRPGFHVFVADKAPWYAIHDHLPQVADPSPAPSPSRSEA